MAVAFGLGLAIGLERQWRQRNAGLRTNVLVAVGAAAFCDLGTRLNGVQGAAQIAAYVVSGIGFLGAGVIVKDGTNDAAVRQRRLVAMHLQQLSARAGHPINLTRIDRRRWMAASRAAQKADYQLLAAEIRRAMP